MAQTKSSPTAAAKQPGLLSRLFARRGNTPRVTPSQRIANAAAYAIQKSGESNADDAYNAAVIANAAAFATMQKSDSVVAVTSETPFLAYRNNNRVPVVVVLRGHGDGVTEVLASHGEVASVGQMQVRGSWQVEVVLLPEQVLFAAIRATDYTGVNLITTAIPLRGKRTVFGG